MQNDYGNNLAHIAVIHHHRSWLNYLRNNASYLLDINNEDNDTPDDLVRDMHKHIPCHKRKRGGIATDKAKDHPPARPKKQARHAKDQNEKLTPARKQKWLTCKQR